jgi:hypothetical protein
MAAKQVFISHISAESEIAQKLKQHLVSSFLGLLDIFVSSDRATIGAGEKWLDEIEKSLKAADAEVVLCSRQSVGRPWINLDSNQRPPPCQGEILLGHSRIRANPGTRR